MRNSLWFVISSCLFLVMCREDNPDKNLAPKNQTATQDALQRSAAMLHVPPSILLAVAYHETHLRYVLSDKGSTELIAPLQETIFGLSLDTLNLAPGAGPVEQIQAYAEWVSGKLGERRLAAQPKNAAEQFEWLVQLAELHRPSLYGQDARVLFVQEMTTLLNEGFRAMDPLDKQNITVQPLNPPIDFEEMAGAMQLRMKLSGGEIHAVDMVFVPSDTHERFKPQGIEILHCPYSLSACLWLQTQKNETVRYGAHYLVPQSNELTRGPLQLVSQSSPVIYTQADGTLTKSQRIRIMLTGNSGLQNHGSRLYGDPLWFTKWQLTRMSQLVDQICMTLANQQVMTYESCRELGLGTQFVAPLGSSERPGEIFGFDAQIFQAHLQDPTGLYEGTELTMGRNPPLYTGQEAVNFNLTTLPAAKVVQLLELVRCPTGNFHWVVRATKLLPPNGQLNFAETFLGHGANQDGVHYVRAKILNAKGKLIGWGAQEFLLTPQKDEEAYILPECS